MRRTCLALVVLVLALAATAAITAPARAADAPQLFILHQEQARPSMIPLYEQTSKEFIAMVRQHRDATPLTFTTFAGTDFLYSFVTPIPNMAAADAVGNVFMALSQAVGEAKWNEFMKRAGEPIEYMRDQVILEDPSMSYTPATPRLKPEEVRFYQFELYYVQPGREAEADALAREIAALHRKKGISDGYRLLKVVMGAEMPLYTVVLGAKDPADRAASEGAALAALGDEGKALFERALALSRRFERREAWIRPDLSLLPAAGTGK